MGYDYEEDESDGWPYVFIAGVHGEFGDWLDGDEYRELRGDDEPPRSVRPKEIVGVNRARDWLELNMEPGKWYLTEELTRDGEKFGFARSAIRKAREEMGITVESGNVRIREEEGKNECRLPIKDAGVRRMEVTNEMKNDRRGDYSNISIEKMLREEILTEPLDCTELTPCQRLEASIVRTAKMHWLLQWISGEKPNLDKLIREHNRRSRGWKVKNDADEKTYAEYLLKRSKQPKSIKAHAPTKLQRELMGDFQLRYEPYYKPRPKKGD